MAEADLSPDVVESQNRALHVLRDRVNDLGPVHADTYPTARSRPTQLMLLVERLRVDARVGDTDRHWVYVVGPTAIGSSTDPMDAAVRLLHLIATDRAGGTRRNTRLDEPATCETATAAASGVNAS